MPNRDPIRARLESTDALERLAGYPQDPDEEPTAPDLRKYLHVLWRRKGTVLLVAFAGAMLGFLYQLPKPPVYRASVSVEIQALNEDFLYSKDVSPNSSMTAMYPELDMATQARILHTRVLQDRVIAKLTGDSALVIHAPADRLASWRAALHLPVSPAPGRAQMIAATAGTVQIVPLKNTRVIDITSDAGDPRLAAAYANAVAAEYIDQTLETRWQSARHTGEWLGRQLDDMKVKLEKSEEQLQSYASAMKLVVTGEKDKSNISEEKLRQLQTELSTAEGERMAKQARYELLSSTRTESVGQVLDDSSLRSLDAKLADLHRELAELSTTLTPAHYKIQKLQAQISETEAEQKRTRDRIAERIYSDFRESERHEKLLAAKYEMQSALVSSEAVKLVHYNLLQREVDSNRQLYESLLQKVKEAGISAALRASNIRVVDPAQAPESPFAPDLRLGLLTGLLFGICGGIGLALIQEKTNRSIRVPSDAAFYLNVPLLGVIPSRSLDPAFQNRQKELPQPGGSVKAPENFVLNDFSSSKSSVAEAFRAVVTSILFSARKRPLQVIVVSSPNISEGKTTIACNLAMAYAEANRSVLLIDCDMRRPRLHHVFGVPNEGGLASMLTGKESLEPRSLFLNAQRSGIPGISVLPSGRPDAGTAILLHSRRLQELVTLAREQFDVILLDTPPMLPLADARIAGSVADGLLMVIRAGQTSRDSATAARQQLAEDGITVVGVVLNDWNPAVAGYYGYEYYGKSYYNADEGVPEPKEDAVQRPS